MSRTTEPSPPAGESASDRDDTTVDPTPPGGIARVDDADVEAAGEADHNFRVLDAPTITAETVVIVPEEPVEPPAIVVADPDPKRPIRSMLGPRDLVQAISTLVVLVGVTVFTFVQLHPSRIFSSAARRSVMSMTEPM